MSDNYEDGQRNQIRKQLVVQAMEELRRGVASLGFKKLSDKLMADHPCPEAISERPDPFKNTERLYVALAGLVHDQIIDNMLELRDDREDGGELYEDAMSGVARILIILSKLVLAFTGNVNHFVDRNTLKVVEKLAHELSVTYLKPYRRDEPLDWGGF